VTRFFRQAFVCLTLGVAFSPSVIAATVELHAAENRQFEIVGIERRSVAYIDNLSRHVVDVAGRYLDASSLQFPQRVLIRLKPERYIDFDGDYEIRVEEGGFVSLNIRWDSCMTLRAVCRGISEALLVRYAIYSFGPEAVERLPDWPAAAIGTRAFLVLRPAMSAELENWIDFSMTPTLASILDRKWMDSVVDANGYCLLHALETEAVIRGRIRRFIEQAIAGEDIRDVLETAIQSNAPDEEAVSGEEWWAEATLEQLSENSDWLEKMEQSRRWIAELSDMSALGEVAEGINLRNLWYAREGEAIRTIIRARYEIVRVRLVRVNPAYFNSAQALGALFETFLDGERRHEYVHRLAIFLSEFEDTKQLEKVVEQALSR
jgi:hypothetical protein